MINYARLRDTLKVFDRDLEDFRDTVDNAVRQQSSGYLTKLDMLSKDKREEARDTAEADIIVMDWQEILQLAIDYEVGVELSFDDYKASKQDFDKQENKRLSSISVREN